jgi:transcriptional regulator with XRE-family HTH domain
MQNSLEQLGRTIAGKVRVLRLERRWTQAELASQLGLSQARLSEIERGDGSLSAEQFVTVLKLFNVDVTDFVPARSHDPLDELQNALARLGARHLQVSADVLPSQRLRAVADAVRETLVLGDQPRLITALAPVLVQNIQALNLHQVNVELAQAGLQRRLGWLVENTAEAAVSTRVKAPRTWASNYRRADVVLRNFLQFVEPQLSDLPEDPAIGVDVLDRGIRSEQTLREQVAVASSISRRWRIATSIRPEDFATALRAAHDTV